jgi:hypothetical protein
MGAFLNPLMLFGLAALAIPIVIHLLSRRRFEVVDWGAMQFLKISETTRRRFFIEELLLLLLRMGLIAVLVLGLAAPFLLVSSGLMEKLGQRTNRDVVLVIDGSFSMGDDSTGKTPHAAAVEWATAFVNDLAAGDTVAVLQAKQEVIPVVGVPTQDLQRVRDALAHLPQPRGGCDWPAAVEEAHKISARGQHTEREVIILSDNQRFGWADDNSLLRWELMKNNLTPVSDLRPHVWVVNLAPDRPENLANWTLAPLRASRAVASAGQQITFRTAIDVRGQDEYRPPHRLRLEVDGNPVADLTPPPTAKLEKGQVPFSFTHRFPTPGSHLVSLIVEPDPPPEQRPAGYVIKDHLPGDNRQDLAVEVLPALPVLIVDGDPKPAEPRSPGRPQHHGTDFLRDALAPARDPNPVVQARVVPIQDFTPSALTAPVGKDAASKPRVLILANVPRLTGTQQEAIDAFLAAGGGVLVTLGERVEQQHYNDELFRRGAGWLPARLDEMAGDEADFAHAPSPLASSFFHPALDLFRDVPVGGLAEARFPRWWKVTTPGKNSPSVPVALLATNDPLFVERPHRNGRVILSAVPLDNSWRTNVTNLAAFAPLAHELVFYLAGARSADYNLQARQPLRYRAESEELLTGLSLQPPEGDAKPLRPDATGADAFPAQVVRQAQGPMLVYENTRDTGVYQLRTKDEQTVYYVVQPDPRESDLAPANDGDREKVAAQVPMTYESDRAKMNAEQKSATHSFEIWWLPLAAMIVLLCGELWLTRRIVRGR